MEKDYLPRMLRKALVEGARKASEAEVIEIAKKCVQFKVRAELLVKSISDAFKIIGEKYEEGVYYLPELVFAGTMAQNVLESLDPILSGVSTKSRSKVVVGTVRGDLHDLGKNIVVMMLKPAGFEVVDLGVDVSPERFVETVRNQKPSILCMSALLSTTRNEMRTVIAELSRNNLRNEVKVVVGGGAVNGEFARELGADGYGKDAFEAIRICAKITGG